MESEIEIWPGSASGVDLKLHQSVSVPALAGHVVGDMVASQDGRILAPSPDTLLSMDPSDGNKLVDSLALEPLGIVGQRLLSFGITDDLHQRVLIYDIAPSAMLIEMSPDGQLRFATSIEFPTACYPTYPKAVPLDYQGDGQLELLVAYNRLVGPDCVVPEVASILEFSSLDGTPNWTRFSSPYIAGFVTGRACSTPMIFRGLE